MPSSHTLGKSLNQGVLRELTILESCNNVIIYSMCETSLLVKPTLVVLLW